MIAGVDAAKKSADKNKRDMQVEQADDQSAEQAVDQSTEREDAPSTEQEGNQSAPADVKYILDSGYSSHKNLAALKDRDVYMPDREFAATMEGKRNPEDRQTKRKAEQEASKSDLTFTYDPPSDVFTCPAGEQLTFRRERIKDGVSYRIYKKYGCASCPLRARCVGAKAKRKELSISSPRLAEIVANKELRAPPYGSHRGGQKHIAYPLALQMREKLKSARGKKIYAHRFPVAEGTIGVIKAARNGHRFLRRGLDRVKTEWIERCIAHNMAKLMQFARA